MNVHGHYILYNALTGISPNSKISCLFVILNILSNNDMKFIQCTEPVIEEIKEEGLHTLSTA